ncbi:WD40 repeat domain-containing protein [Streptacidiphilus sp. PAMC 29251]
MSVVRWPLTAPVLSLNWDGDELVDWAGGNRRWQADGTEVLAFHHHGFDFDRAVSSPSSRFHAVYRVRGTKGAIFDRTEKLREINRSRYSSGAYEYPIALGWLPDGREVIAHCPEVYDRLHIDELATGRRLTARDGESEDFFHSRLAFSPNGRRLLSAGWGWHPISSAMVFDVATALADPATLDGEGLLAAGFGFESEIESACWLSDDSLVLSGLPDPFWSGRDAVGPDDDLRPDEIGVWSLTDSAWTTRHTMDVRIGTMLTLHGALVLSLYGHPKVVDTNSGEVVQDWPDLVTGHQESSIINRASVPPVAVHPSGTRFAVAAADGITVVTLTDHPATGRSSFEQVRQW